jgi:hypothetical protein
MIARISKVALPPPPPHPPPNNPLSYNILGTPGFLLVKYPDFQVKIIIRNIVKEKNI